MRPTSVPSSGTNACRRITSSFLMRSCPGTVTSFPAPCTLSDMLPTMFLAYTWLPLTRRIKANWLLASTSRSRAALCVGVELSDTTADFVLQEVHISGVSTTARARLSVLAAAFKPVMCCIPLRVHAVVVFLFFIITVCFLVVNSVYVLSKRERLLMRKGLLKVKN